MARLSGTDGNDGTPSWLAQTGTDVGAAAPIDTSTWFDSSRPPDESPID